MNTSLVLYRFGTRAMSNLTREQLLNKLGMINSLLRDGLPEAFAIGLIRKIVYADEIDAVAESYAGPASEDYPLGRTDFSRLSGVCSEPSRSRFSQAKASFVPNPPLKQTA
jgi:hypothetical protein